jgi:hypothetical protein
MAQTGSKTQLSQKVSSSTVGDERLHRKQQEDFENHITRYPERQQRQALADLARRGSV